MRTLAILRHAKSAYPPGVADADRPLGSRGERDAPEAGRWLREHCACFDAVVVSPATRTRATWELVRAELEGPPRAVFDARVYAAGVPELLAALRDVPAQAEHVLLIGHNPGLEDLAEELGGSDFTAAWVSLGSKFPTSAVAVFAIEGPWADLPSGARLREVAVPRG